MAKRWEAVIVRRIIWGDNIMGNLLPGDTREMADETWYPEKYTAAAYCYGVNYVLYTMTY